MTKIRLTLHPDTHQLLTWALDTLRKPGGILPELAVESRVLLDFHQRNLVKLAMEKPPFDIKLKPHEAISLRRLLYRIDLQDVMAAISRDDLCDEVQRQLPVNLQ